MNRKNSVYTLDMLILASLYHSDCYGYEISKNIRDVTKQKIDIKDGVMYPILYRLLKSNFISSYEKQVGRKIRVYYHIEPLGIDYLLKSIDEYNEMLESISLILEGISQ